MSKPNMERPAGRGPMMERPGGLTAGTIRLATLAGVAVLVVLNFSSWREAQKTQKTLADRLSNIETRLNLVSAKLDTQARAPQRAAGPDPNKVHTVRTDGAPFKGPQNAPITVVEFSDFQ
ncbi:MAG: hypothetical protein ACRD6R_00720 [Candidatus Polarisedimenticolia bacterium]